MGALARAIEVALSLTALALALPLLAVLAAAIRLDSAGPAIFAQTRIGRNGRPFRIYKLRTMRWGAPDCPTHEIAEREITRLGRLLRRTKLDELPQLINVLQGDMGLVGPRPCLATQTSLIQGRLQRGALSVRPGITGLAQAMGIDMSDVQRLVEVDAYYVANRSLPGDLRILIATVLGESFLPRPDNSRATM